MAKSCDYSVAVASAALLFLPSLLLHCAAVGTVHVVGDKSGWIVPSSKPKLYTTWASSNTFHLNDVLTFNFTETQHDVVRVPIESYDSCSTNNQIGETITTSPANVTLNEPGTYYFICAVAGHCKGGQKLEVFVPLPDLHDPPCVHFLVESRCWLGPLPPFPGYADLPLPSSAGSPAIAGALFFILLSFALGELIL